MLTPKDLQALQAEFPRDRLGVKVQSLNRDRNRALLVLYLQHTDVQDRLDQVDPAWFSEIAHEERVGETVYVRCRLTVKGVSRENVGEGSDPKSAYSDSLKRAAMLFGVGRYLYESTPVWVDYDEARDRFRAWTAADYDAAAAGRRVPPEGKPGPRKTTPTPAARGRSGAGAREAAPGASAQPRPRDELNRVLMGLYRPYLNKHPGTRFTELLAERYGVPETRLMTVEQLEDLIVFMEERIRAAA